MESGFNRIISFFTGYVEVLIQGPHLEKMINFTTNSGLYIWDIRRLDPETIQVKMRAHGFLRIREMARRSGSTVRIERKKGWPFIGRKLTQRKAFVLGALLFLAVLLYLSTFVLFIKIEGFTGRDREQLMTLLQKNGLRPGVSRNDILKQKNFIERSTIIGTPKAVWLAITIRGIVAEVKVTPRRTAPIAIVAGDIVAGRSGIISKLVVLRGVPVVKEGDSVARGDLLISGTIWHGDPKEGVLEKEEVVATGIVEGRVWYDLEVLEPKIIWKVMFKKPQNTQYKLRWGSKLWTLASFGNKKWATNHTPNSAYSLTRFQRTIYRGRNPGEVVELIKDIRRPVFWGRVKRSMGEIKRAARAELDAKLAYFQQQEKITPHLTWTDQGGFIKLTMTVETVQDLAMVAFRRKESR
ncbi:MAG TPA: sporulation protein YqfD [Bacillota bacterium]|nr:sporulation protein YqfD [Bacillota bacterium]